MKVGRTYVLSLFLIVFNPFLHIINKKNLNYQARKIHRYPGKFIGIQFLI